MNRYARPAWAGGIGAGAILALYFAVLTLVSGWGFALAEFGNSWGYILALAAGFGVQMGLYWHLRSVVREMSAKIVAASGTTSTLAMISCCAHYLANLLPILGAAGVATLVAQYQTQLFWVGIGFNLVGIVVIAQRIYYHTHHDMEP